MDRLQQRHRIVEALRLPSMIIKATIAFLIVLSFRFLFSSTWVSRIIIFILAGDLSAERLPLPYLMVIFVGLMGLIELVSFMCMVCRRCTPHVVVGIFYAVIFALFYRWVLD